MVRRRAGRKRKVGVARKADNRIKTREYSERPGPTPEALKRRETLLGSRTAQGEVDCILDVLAAHSIITDRQAEAGKRYASARLSALRAKGINPAPSSPKLSDWVDSGFVPGGDGDNGDADYRWRRARQCVFDCGAQVRAAVERVCLDNAEPRGVEIIRLRIGLDALVRLWRV